MFIQGKVMLWKSGFNYNFRTHSSNSPLSLYSRTFVFCCGLCTHLEGTRIWKGGATATLNHKGARLFTLHRFWEYSCSYEKGYSKRTHWGKTWQGRIEEAMENWRVTTPSVHTAWTVWYPPFQLQNYTVVNLYAQLVWFFGRTSRGFFKITL